ncbi:hypothetical protein K4K57_005974 [Colletotrichum sp. SAR 10_99]|nr:hypothetical protein K4K57_005974 [Colletotrichum sp. SAR 10_99]
MDIPDHVMFSRRLAELTGESRDRNLRPFLEEQAKKLIDDLFWGEDNVASEWFDANISLVINLEQNPGTIFLGKDEATEYFKNLKDENNKSGPAGPTKNEVIIITMDLNDSNKIQRMEYRLLCEEHDAEQVPNWDWDETVDSLKTKPVVIDYNI